MKKYIVLIALSAIFISCKKEDPEIKKPSLIFRFKLDSTQLRLNNIGEPAGVPAGNAAQSPDFNGISAHYLELAPNAFTALGSGTVLYHQAETTKGGANAIDHSKAIIRKNGETFLEIPLSDIQPGTYEWLRLSLAYQNYQVSFKVDTIISGITIQKDVKGSIASFLGFNTYIQSFQVKDSTVIVNANKKQGYWAFEFFGSVGPFSLGKVLSGESSNTTVPNPLFASSPIPAGSCVVTGSFKDGPLVISGAENQDIIVDVSLSINKSFEWKEVVNDGKWEPLKGENVVDMGIRGMIPMIVK